MQLKCFITALLALGLLLLGCSMKPADSGSPSLAAKSVELSGFTVGLQNFRELYGSWVALTGVDTTKAVNTGGVSLRTYYLDNAQNILPATGVVSEASNSVFFVSAVLAANIASIFVKQEILLLAPSRKITNQVNYAAVANQLNGPSGQAIVDDVATRAFSLFLSRPPTPDELQIVEQSVADCVAGSATSATTTTDTRNCMIAEIAGIMNCINALQI